MDAVRTEALTKYYGKTRGIEDVSLRVEPEECFGFIGPNGAGKSTTIRTLLGLLRPTSGRAWVLGMDVEKERERILSRTGYLPAEAAFYPGMRVRDMLKLSADLRKMDCKREAARLCERLRLDPSRKVEELSLGNRKKTAIVCALQHRPELLILDEPTGGLDPLMQREFFAILQERVREGTAVFLSSHILSEIRQHCTRAAVIREGRIVACGGVEELACAGARQVRICGHAGLEKLDGVQRLRMSAEGAEFLYAGDMRCLLSVLAEGDVQDLVISEPSLDEGILQYYEEGGGQI